MEVYVKHYILKINLFFIFLSFYKVDASSLEVGAEYNFHDALNYAFYSDIDTLILTTSGGIYTTPEITAMDSQQFVIYEPIVIMAAPGLAERPIFTHPNGGESTSKEIFRILDDVEFKGVSFMGGIEETNGCKYGLRYGDYLNPVTDELTRGSEGTVMKFYDCHFEGFHSLKDQNEQGNVLYFKRPEDEDLTQNNLRNTTVIFENCTFRDIGDEAIRISEGEKYGGDDGVVACSLLVVRNCTFDDIDSECIRVYADKDTSSVGPSNIDGNLIFDHVTIVNSAPEVIFAKNFRTATVTNVLIAYGREPGIYRPDRGAFSLQVQLSGSTISHVDTFNLVFTEPIQSSGRIGGVKGAYVDTATVYNYDPMFVDYANGDYTLAEGSPLYGIGSDGEAIGDLRWATNPSMALEEDNLPKRFRLSQNYPNPFNPQTTIDFYLSKSGEASLKIYDLEGRFISSPINGFTRSGYHSTRFDGRHLPNGIYFYQLQSGDEVSLRKMLLVK